MPIPQGSKRRSSLSLKTGSSPTPEIIKKVEEPVTEIKINTTPTSSPTKNQAPSFADKMSQISQKENVGPYEYYYPKKEKESMAGSSERSVGIPKKIILGGIALVLIAGFIISMMTVFASATISLKPKTQNILVDTEIAASINKQAGAVSYEVLKFSKSKTASVPASGEEAVELKASGKIIIYNNFSTEPQRLIVRTRFESPEGLIYRIPESVVIPGKTTKGGVETPGSVEVQVFADEAGDKYNIKKTDFTIPGFKNDSARFKGFYARSVDSMTGGFVGKKKVATPADRQTALSGIDTELKADLEKELQAKIPEDLILLQNSIVFTAKELPEEDGDSNIVLGKEMTAHVFMFNKKDLSDKIVTDYIASSSEWQGIKAKINDFSALAITELPTNLSSIPEKLNLQVRGQAAVSADLDTALIGQKLLGAPKSSAASLMDDFAGISSVTAIIRPVWKRSFPDNPTKIYVEVAP